MEFQSGLVKQTNLTQLKKPGSIDNGFQRIEDVNFSVGLPRATFGTPFDTKECDAVKCEIAICM
jgi:hypothetical protein